MPRRFSSYKKQLAVAKAYKLGEQRRRAARLKKIWEENKKSA